MIRRGAGYSFAWSIRVEYKYPVYFKFHLVAQHGCRTSPGVHGMACCVRLVLWCIKWCHSQQGPAREYKKHLHSFATPVMSCDASVVLTLFGRYEAQRRELPSQRPSSLPDGGTGYWSPATRAQSLGCWPYTIENHEQKYHSCNSQTVISAPRTSSVKAWQKR